MAEAAKFLQPHVEAIMAATDFAQLHDRVGVLRGGVDRIGDLAIYDITQRIGCYRGIEPDAIYLHRGTREGARALGWRENSPTMPVAALRPEFQALSSAQLEDILCIYKDEIGSVVAEP